MRKIRYIIGILWLQLLLSVWFAQNNTWNNILSNIWNGVITSWSTNTWANLLDPRNIYISAETIQKMYFTTSWDNVIHDYIRKYIISQMMENKFNKFEVHPNFGFSSIYLKYPKEKNAKMDFAVAINAKNKDTLDKYISNYTDKYKNYTSEQKFDPSNFENFVLFYDDYKKRSNIYLFKNEKEIRNLWYVLTSYRTRTNNDTEYRRYNIKTAFYYFGNIRVINPGETVYYMEEINYDPRAMKNYMSWLSIVNDNEIPTYGGWLCGSSTAIYQWILSNKWLSIKSRSHSKWRDSLYSANIDGQYVSSPWLDSTIYNSKYDFVITNNTKYPIIIVSNFDGKKWSQEQNFTISKSENIWWYYKAKKNQIVTKKSAKWNYKCYSWVINNKAKSSCYKTINDKNV